MAANSTFLCRCGIAFSAVSLLQAFWTPLSLRPPFTTAAFPAILCRCGTLFSAAPFLQTFWTALPLRAPSTTAAFPAILCRCGIAFSAVSLLQAFWTALASPGPFPQRQHFPRFSAVAVRHFPPHPFYRPSGRRCLSGPFPQRQHFPQFTAIAEALFAVSFAIAHVNDTVVPPSLFGSYHNGTDYLIFLPLWNSFFRRIPAADPLDAIVSPVLFHNGSISRNSLPLRKPCFAISFAIAHVNDTVVPPSLFDSFRNGTDSRISRHRGKDRRAHLPKVIRILPDLARLRKVGEGGWKQKYGHRSYRGPRAIAHLRKVSRKRGKTAHLRKVGEGGWKQKRGHRSYRGPRAIAHLRKVSRKRGKTAHLRKERTNCGKVRLLSKE